MIKVLFPTKAESIKVRSSGSWHDTLLRLHLLWVYPLYLIVSLLEPPMLSRSMAGISSLFSLFTQRTGRLDKGETICIMAGQVTMVSAIAGQLFPLDFYSYDSLICRQGVITSSS
ncbi:hypothetical protein Tco_0955569 [Tanacetum coccineum]|uniref:Uncharacterized protein n=1 Tax=Tanacetum coccineum TaxID=301880 RepID=A0ABQ5E7Q2_9ASTR